MHKRKHKCVMKPKRAVSMDKRAKSKRDNAFYARLGLREGQQVKSSNFARWNGSASYESARSAKRHW